MICRFAASIGLVLALVILASCSRGGKERVFVVDGHRFAVPEVVVLPAQVMRFPWPTKSESLHFIIDSGKPVGQRASALLESRKITCRPDKIGTSPMLATACSTVGVPVLPTSNLLKEHQFEGNDAFWQYTAEDASSNRHPVASCYAVGSDVSAGSCSAFGRYSSLVYSFSFDDSEIGNLNDVRARIEELLGAWEQK